MKILVANRSKKTDTFEVESYWMALQPMKRFWIYLRRPCYVEIGNLLTIIEMYESGYVEYPAKCTNVRVISDRSTVEIEARYTGRNEDIVFGWHVLPTSHPRYKPLKIR